MADFAHLFFLVKRFSRIYGISKVIGLNYHLDYKYHLYLLMALISIQVKAKISSRIEFGENTKPTKKGSDPLL